MDKKPKEDKPKSKGLGDTIAKITKIIGIEPCSECDKRRQAWNERFPYNQSK